MIDPQAIPATLFEFQDRFSTEEECERFLFAWRWPQGFRCPRCSGSDHLKLAHRRQYQCRNCRYQVSITAGTVMQDTKLKLRVWFWAMFLVARHKKSISALQLQRDLALGSYRTAWALLQKIRNCFDESSDYPLKGVVEVDETLVGAKGKGAQTGKRLGNKAIVVAAIELGEGTRRGHRWQSVRAQKVPDYKGVTLRGFVKDAVDPESTLLIDGWQSYNKLEEDGFTLERFVSSSMNKAEMRAANPMPHIHLFFSNLKTWITGRFHGVSQKYLQNYINEFVYRLNRRRTPPQIFGWVARRLMQADPCTLMNITSNETSA